MEPVSPRATDRTQAHPEGEPRARIGSSLGHRNPTFSWPQPRPGKDAAINHLLSRVGVAASSRLPQRPADSTGGMAGWFARLKKSPGVILVHRRHIGIRSPRAASESGPGLLDTLESGRGDEKRLALGTPRCSKRCGGGMAGLSPGTTRDQPTRITTSSFGPWAPRTRIRSMSPVRLGPVMKESMLGR